MERQEKTAKIYFFLFALTEMFLCSLLFALRAQTSGDKWENMSVTTERTTTEETAPRRVLVNVNTASAAELEALSGVGPTLAQAIVAYRAEHGDFQSVEELLEVKGIGEAKLEEFRVEITISNEEADQ